MAVESSSINRQSSLALIASDIKIAHSVFALPFAILAAFMAALGHTRWTWLVSAGPGGLDPMERYQHVHLHSDYSPQFWPAFLKQLALIVLAMVLARTVAMLANRWLDRRIDRHNPRTMNRPLASGRLSPAIAISVMILCAASFMLVCAAFGFLFNNWWPLILALPVLAWISAYGYFKRFTALCHIYLGSSLALSPIAAAIAIEPESIVPWSPVFQCGLWLLSGMVLCWVAGFDIIYALQDVEVDRAQNLYSLPARLGVRRAMRISRLLHALAVACLFALATIDHRFGMLFLSGCIIVTALLIYEHLTVSRWGTPKIALAFFTLNGVISCLLGALGVFDLVAV